MNALLYLPGLLVILFRKKGLLGTLGHVSLVGAIQALVALPFLLNQPYSYITNAYDFSRVFLYKWTVNWRFLKEEWFLDRRFAMMLLCGHAFALIMFGLFRWCKSEGGTLALLSRGFRHCTRSPALQPVTADCKYGLQLLRNSYLTIEIVSRCYYRTLHFESPWYHVCKVFALPVLLVVCSATPIPIIADEISHHQPVSHAVTY